MESLNRKALIAFCILLGLNLLVRGFVRSKEGVPSRLETVYIDPESVVKITLQKGTEQVVYTWVDTSWVREVPLPAEGTGAENHRAGHLRSSQEQTLKDYLHRICSMVREWIGPLPEGSLADFGLDDKQATIVRLYNSHQGEPFFAFRLGHPLPLNVAYRYGIFIEKQGLFKVLSSYQIPSELW
ncbi:MAG: hypothetical protein SNJ78_08005 [Spirochaetales bacterium]